MFKMTRVRRQQPFGRLERLSGDLIDGIATTIPQRIPAENGHNFRRQLRLHRFP